MSGTPEREPAVQAWYDEEKDFNKRPFQRVPLVLTEWVYTKFGIILKESTLSSRNFNKVVHRPTNRLINKFSVNHKEYPTNRVTAHSKLYQFLK
jgi:hypothetical protein